MTTTHQNPASTRRGECATSTCRPTGATRGFTPAVDILETPEAYLLVADVPGATAETIDVNFERGELTLRARVTQRNGSTTRFVRREYAIGDYERTFRLSESIDSTKIEATLSHGVLHLMLPKAESVKTRRVPIRGA